MDNNQPFDIWVCLNMGYTLMDQQIEYSIFRQTDIISPVCNILQLLSYLSVGKITMCLLFNPSFAG